VVCVDGAGGREGFSACGGRGEVPDLVQGFGFRVECIVYFGAAAPATLNHKPQVKNNQRGAGEGGSACGGRGEVPDLVQCFGFRV